MTRLLALVFSVSFYNATPAVSQEFMQLWSKGHMPDSKGIVVKDSIANERVYQVGVPGMYVFVPSKEENTGAAVVICPGGGYARLAYIVSGFQLAKWFNTQGISAFVLNYRLPHSPDLIRPAEAPITDVQRAIKMIRGRATQWNVNPKKIGVLGCSAGGHLAAMASTVARDFATAGDSLDRQSFRPDFSILVSPVIDMGQYAHKGSRQNLLGKDTLPLTIQQYSAQLQVTSTTPPAFIVGATDDKVVDPMNSLVYYQSLLQHKVPASYHVFPQGGHSIAVTNNPGSTGLWTSLCEAWLREINMLPQKK